MRRKSSTFLLIILSSVLTMAIGAPAQAQEPADTDEAEREIEEIIVTGSHIRRAGYDTLQPATSFDGEEFDARAFFNIADALNESPAFGRAGNTPDDTRQAQSNLGQNFVNLFGLGSQRTLVLLNGRRIVASNPPTSSGTSAGGDNAGLQVDFNIMPTALIERVETIYTGGSPIYGNDAIAGTVNVILKDDFEGLVFDGQYGMSGEGDGVEYRGRIVYGSDFSEGKGNTVFSMEYQESERLDNSARPATYGAGSSGGSRCDTRVSIFGFDGTDPNDGQPRQAICKDAVHFWVWPNTGGPHPLNEPLGNPNALNPDGVPNEDSDGDGILDRHNFLSAGRRAGQFIDASGNSNPGNFFVDENGSPWIFSLDGQDIVTFDDANMGNVYGSFVTQGVGGLSNPYFTHSAEHEQLRPLTERFTLFNASHYDLTDKVRFFSEVLFSHTEVTDFKSQPEWSGRTFVRSGALGIKLDNPYLPDRARQLIAAQLPDADGDGVADLNLDTDGDGLPDDTGFLMSRSNLDLTIAKGGKFREQNTYRVLGGLMGDVTFGDKDWTWDAAYYFGETTSTSTRAVPNQYRRSLALDAVVDPATNETVCRSSLDTPPDLRQGNIGSFPVSADVENCTPFNPFGYDNYSEEAADYIFHNRFYRSVLEQTVFEANASGDLLDLPAGTLAAAVGYVHRDEQASFFADEATTVIIPGRRAIDPVNAAGGFFTNEYYAEVYVPVFGQGFTPIPFLEGLSLEAAYRSLDNNVIGSDSTWTVGGRLNLRLPLLGEGGFQIRGNVTQAVRAPSNLELFLPQSGAASTMTDPCDPRFINSGPNPTLRRSNCEAQVAAGKADGSVDPTFLLDQFFSEVTGIRTDTTVGGNPNLTSEIADSWTIGLVIRPENWRGVQASIDWISIDVEDAIQQVNGTQLGNSCYDNTGHPDSEACTFITRDFGFQVIHMVTPFRNAAQRVFEGAVVNASWQFDAAALPFGDLPGEINLVADVAFIDESFLTVGGGDLTTFVNSQGGRIYAPKYRWTADLAYIFSKYDLRWRTTYEGEGFYSLAAGIDRTPDGIAPEKFDPLWLSTIMAAVRVTDVLSVQLVVENVFDERGHITRLAATGTQGTMPYVVGRIFTLGIKAAF